MDDYKADYKRFLNLNNHYEQYAMSFPIAVFGTLRKIPRDQGNLRRMLVRKPIGHKKAFVPHVLPSGIWVDFQKGASGLFEVFFYNEVDFPAVIKTVDALEGFHPDCHYGYNRTLLNVHLLPDDYPEHLFNKGITWENRTLKIPEKEWKNFETVPAWGYSNNETNSGLERMNDSPLLWYRS